MPDRELSSEAQKLVELCGVGEKEKLSVYVALKEHPELSGALDEYIKYREERVKTVKRQTTIPRAQHSITNIARILKKKLKPK